jgi:excisionase family DNA binding protein
MEKSVLTKNRKRRLTWPLWMTPQDVADMFGVSRNTVYEWVKSGEIPYRKLGQQIFIDRDALFLRGRTG